MKKLLLTLVPALMLLGSCSGAQPQVENKLFQEETIAREEVAKKVRKNEITPAVTPKAPKIGVRVKNHNNGYHSIRFLAAITADDLSTIKASWTRTMYLSTGGIQKETRSNIACTFAYTKLVDETGKGFINISDAGFEGYNCFVVYTMTNVPDEFLGSYLNAQLTIDSKNDLFDFTTDIMSSTIDESKQVSFPAGKTGYFLAGKIGEEKTKNADGSTRGDDNYASFTVNVAKGDQFFVVHNTAENFQVFGSEIIQGYQFKDGGNGSIEANFSGDFVLFLNDKNQLYTAVEDGYYLIGNFSTYGGNWAVVDPQYKLDPGTDGNIAQLLGYNFPNATNFQVVKVTNGVYEWHGAPSGGDILVSAGNYNIYLANNGAVYHVQNTRGGIILTQSHGETHVGEVYVHLTGAGDIENAPAPGVVLSSLVNSYGILEVPITADYNTATFNCVYNNEIMVHVSMTISDILDGSEIRDSSWGENTGFWIGYRQYGYGNYDPTDQIG